jgi:hypothetical protein
VCPLLPRDSLPHNEKGNSKKQLTGFNEKWVFSKIRFKKRKKPLHIVWEFLVVCSVDYFIWLEAHTSKMQRWIRFRWFLDWISDFIKSQKQ